MTGDEGNLLFRATDLRKSGETAVVVTVVRGSGLGNRILVTKDAATGSVGSPEIDRWATRVARERLDNGVSGLQPLADDIDVFIDVFRPEPLLLLIGGVHMAQAVAALARNLDYRIVVADPREALANRDRFPDVDDIVIAWPDDAYTKLTIADDTAIVILTHDPKFDEPAIVGALGTPAGYIGAVGSRKTVADRLVRLREAGVTDDQLERIHAPIGLNIGGNTPAEMALSILAEVVAVRNQRPGGFLRDGSGSIRTNV